jgi:hypothetical protein
LKHESLPGWKMNSDETVDYGCRNKDPRGKFAVTENCQCDQDDRTEHDVLSPLDETEKPYSKSSL